MGIDIDKIKVIDDDLIGRLKNPDFYNNHIVNIGMGAHAYSLTYEQDEKGQGAFYVYNPHSQGVPIQINDIDAFFDKYDLIQAITVSEK